MDRRRRKTREAIVGSFTRLFFEHGYHGFSMNAVAADADVGRSTLYTHFRRKEEVLSASMGFHLDILADSLDSPNDEQLIGLMRHFWGARRHRAVFSPGPSRNALAADLAGRVEQRLEASGWRVPKALVARLVADHQLNIVDHWLSLHISLQASDIAAMLARSTRGLRDTLRGGR